MLLQLFAQPIHGKSRCHGSGTLEAHHQGRRLHAGGRVLGTQEHAAVLGDAGHEAGAAGPLHRGNRISSDGQRVVGAQDIRVLADAHVIALVLRAAVQNCHHLFARHGIVAPYTGREIETKRYCSRLVLPVEE